MLPRNEARDCMSPVNVLSRSGEHVCEDSCKYDFKSEVHVNEKSFKHLFRGVEHVFVRSYENMLPMSKACVCEESL